MTFDITIPSVTGTLIRDAIKYAGGLLTSAGLVSDSDAQFYGGIAMLVAATGYAVVKQVKMREARVLTLGDTDALIAKLDQAGER